MEHFAHGLLDDYEIRMVTIKSRAMTGRAGLTEDDLDDIRQEILLYIIKHLPHYNPALAGRHTYINDLIDNCIANIFKSRNAEKRDWRKTAAFTEECENAFRDGSFSLSDQVTYEMLPWSNSQLTPVEIVELREDILRVLKKLPPNLRDICLKLISKNLTEIAAEAGIPKTTLSYHVKLIRQAFTDAGLEKYF